MTRQHLLAWIFLATGALAFPSPGYTQPGSATASKVSTIVAQYLENNAFSGTILVAKAGQPVFHQSYGLGYIPAADTLRNHYHYAIASVTKLFTAIRVLQLVENGQLELNTAVTSYLPHWRSDISDRVSIHHLLLHISGLPNEQDKVYRHQRNDHYSE